MLKGILTAFHAYGADPGGYPREAWGSMPRLHEPGATSEDIGAHGARSAFSADHEIRGCVEPSLCLCLSDAR